MRACRYCHRCGISFRMVDEFRPRGEVSKCSVPGCGWVFHHGHSKSGRITMEMLK